MGVGVPWLGMTIADLTNIDTAFVIGSFLRRDHPLFAARLRQAAKSGAKLTFLHASNDDSLIPAAHRVVAAPSAWLDAARGHRCARLPKRTASHCRMRLRAAKRRRLPRMWRRRCRRARSASCCSATARSSIPISPQIQAAAQWIADSTGATLGFLTEAANTVGAHLVDALPGEGGLNAREVFEQPRKGYVLLNVEPEFDTANPAQALAALKQAEMVVAMSPFRHGADYADVLLPIAPFTETSGTFVNAEGTAQTFNGVVRPLGETRPAGRCCACSAACWACRASNSTPPKKCARRAGRRAI